MRRRDSNPLLAQHGVPGAPRCPYRRDVPQCL